jgi:thiol:disulfide interchange protein DsbD
LVILAGVFFVGRAMRAEPWTINWIDCDDQSIEQLKKKNKPILIDFYADWCAACRELDSETFGDRKVVEESRKFTMLRVDCTSPDEESRSLIRRFNVTGLPTLVFISPKGEELDGLRVVGFFGPSEMLTRMEQAVQGKQGAYRSEDSSIPTSINPSVTEFLNP